MLLHFKIFVIITRNSPSQLKASFLKGADFKNILIGAFGCDGIMQTNILLKISEICDRFLVI